MVTPMSAGIVHAFTSRTAYRADVPAKPPEMAADNLACEQTRHGIEWNRRGPRAFSPKNGCGNDRSSGTQKISLQSRSLSASYEKPYSCRSVTQSGILTLLRETLLKSEAFLARDLVGTFCDVDSSIIPALSPTPWLPLSPRPTMSAKLREIE
jgi:hypothetical protein